uniref:Uncharacterized protein n=1 Tax=Suricata suricatta TaxID=37032 RepID=A0A673UYJ3_SURSU
MALVSGVTLRLRQGKTRNGGFRPERGTNVDMLVLHGAVQLALRSVGLELSWFSYLLTDITETMEIYFIMLKVIFLVFSVPCFSFKTLLQQDVKKRRGYGNSSDSRYDDGRGPPGNPPRRMGRINHLRGPSPPPMAGG